ncbi:zinc finger protein 407 isoform X2 [Channa argus]|uniref:zinc finger protein 407 isoform X2 n=1 Tax=Channa argus TaxID=215402 RepID=UPI003521CC3C
MDKTLISGERAIEGKVPEGDSSGKLQQDDVEMEETTTDSSSRTAEPNEADEELAKRPLPDSVQESGETVCSACGFSAKCSRSLKIHYAKMHKKNLKNTVKTLKPTKKSEDAFDISLTEMQEEDNSMNKKGLIKKQSVLKKQQADQEETVTTQERRVSKRTPKPKMIYSCNYCGQEFRDKSPLDAHVQRNHTKDTPYTFDADEHMDEEEEAEDPVSSVKATPTQVASRHMLNRFQLKCVHCDFRVSTPALLESHTQAEHLDQEWYRCKLCNFISATIEWMHTHLSSDGHMEKQKRKESVELSSFDAYVENVSSDNVQNANTNDRAHVSKAGGSASSKREQETEETAEAAEAAEAVLAEEEDLDLEPPRKKRGRPKQGSTTTCGYCGLVVSNATNLSVHVRRKHSKEYGYSCTLCNYSCVTKGDMDRHCITKKHVRRAQECATKNPVSNHTNASSQEPGNTQAQEPNGEPQTTCTQLDSNTTASKEHSEEEQTQAGTSQKTITFDTINACSHCDFVAQSIPSLHLHIKRKHTKDFEYVCLACSYYAVTSREMSRHASTEKHKHKSQKYLEQVGSEGQRALPLPLKPKEVIELAGANTNAEGVSSSPTEEFPLCSDDKNHIVESQNTVLSSVSTEPVVVDVVVTTPGNTEEKQAEGITSTCGARDATKQTVGLMVPSDPQQVLSHLQPADNQIAQQENQEEGGKQGDNEPINADVMIIDAKSESSPSDTHMSKAVPFDACIISVKALAEQEQELQEGLALEGEAAVICLTGGSPVPIDLLPSSSAYVKKLKSKEAKVREEAKGNSSRIRCEDCGFMADGISGLNVHISMKHPSKEKHFHCLVCGKSFYSESNLHQHLNSAAHHRNEQNSVEELPEGGASFKCVKCTDRFDSEQDLFVHIKEKHEELLREVNKYVVEDTEQINREREENQGSVCKYCGKVCKSSNSMAFLAHIRTHTAPPFAGVTMQAVEELVKQCVQREVSTLQKSLEELARDHKKALEDNSSLRRTVGEMVRELAKLRKDNSSFRQTLQRMTKRDVDGDQNYEQQLLQEQVLPLQLSHSPNPPQTLACGSSSSCTKTVFSAHLSLSPDRATSNNSTPAVRTASTPNILPDINLQPVDPKVEEKIFSVTKIRYGPRRPDDYAAKMFMMIVDFTTYLSWAQKVNWNGSEGKQGLPRNVILKLKELLQHRFEDISNREWKDIRDRVNERLRNPRKVDPRTERCFL